MSPANVLVVTAGLPGAGKSAVAEGVARALGCAVLSVDPIEAALWRAGVERGQPTGLAAYVVAEDLAHEQLRLGHDVVVDAVNDDPAAREQWRALGARHGLRPTYLEVVCPDEELHRTRLERRVRSIAGFPEPTWESVAVRRGAFRDWDDERVTLDSTQPLAQVLALALDHVERSRRAP